MKEDPALKKSSRGWLSYVILLATFLMIAMVLNSTINPAVS